MDPRKRPVAGRRLRGGAVPRLSGWARPQVTGRGFDADAGAVEAAQGTAQAHFPDGRIAFRHSAVGDAWPAGPFDLVSMIDVLHHTPPPAQQGAILQAYDHVAPGGLFLYKDMAERPFVRAWWSRLHDIVVARQWINYRRIAEVEAWLRAEIVERSLKKPGLDATELFVAKEQAPKRVLVMIHLSC